MTPIIHSKFLKDLTVTHLFLGLRSTISPPQFLMYGFLLSMLISCNSPEIDFKSFEPKKWQESVHLENNYRGEVIENMKSEFKLLRNLDEGELVKILGKPDETHLYRRGQKFFHYHLYFDNEEMNTDLKIRFSALGLVNELLIWEN